MCVLAEKGVFFIKIISKVFLTFFIYQKSGDYITMMLKLTSPMCQSVNHYLKPRSFIRNGRAMVTMYESAEAKRYKKDFAAHIRHEMIRQGITWIPNKTQHFYVDAIFYFDRTDNDCNNRWKLICDAITDSRCVWLDDNVCCERVMAIRYDSKNPRIELTIYPVDYIGIFDSREQFDTFEANCTRCTRYKNGKCSILRKATEGRIQDEIKDMICSKFKQNNIQKQGNYIYEIHNAADTRNPRTIVQPVHGFVRK